VPTPLFQCSTAPEAWFLQNSLFFSLLFRDSVTLLRQIEVLLAQGKSAPEACRDTGKSQQN
jgi:hypothetical protein